MPSAVVATAGATNANSYVTIAEADAIMDDRLYATSWTGASSDDKIRAVLWATQLLDAFMEWNGSTRNVDPEQALGWPRSGVINDKGLFFDYDSIPQLLKEATTELATALLANNRFVRPSTLGQGFSRAKVGPIEVEVSDQEVEDLIPQNVLTMLEPLGRMKGSAFVGSRVLRLERT